MLSSFPFYSQVFLAIKLTALKSHGGRLFLATMRKIAQTNKNTSKRAVRSLRSDFHLA